MNRPQLLVAGPLFLHDNARPHIADVVTNKLRDYEWEMLPYAPYSPHTSPSDFDLHLKLKELMRGRRSVSLEELSIDGTRDIRHMNKSCVLDASQTLGLRY